MNSTMFIDQLKELYGDNSKHSNYQNVPRFIQEDLGYNEVIDESWRGDTARYHYISRYLEGASYGKLLDVGANTGFFSLSLAEKDPLKQVVAYEPNRNHASFIEIVAKNYNFNHITVKNQGLNIEEIESIDEFDVMLLLNVLHHAGVEYDSEFIKDTTEFWRYFEKIMYRLSNKGRTIIFQIGYNWGGDKSLPIIPTDNLLEMLQATLEHSKSAGWAIDKVAYYVRDLGAYIDMDVSDFSHAAAFFEQYNIDINSEFYKRPIVILTR